MATRQSAQALISPTDLRNCTDAATIFELFRKLRYPAERPVPVNIEQGELPELLRAGIAERYLVAQVAGARAGDPSLDRRTTRRKPLGFSPRRRGGCAWL